MKQSKSCILIIYPMDPMGCKIGGVEVFIKNFIKYLPDEFELEFIGVTSNKQARPVGRWQETELFGRKFKFFPVLHVRDENARGKIPLSLKFTISLSRYKGLVPLEDRILIFHRIEPSISFMNSHNKKVLFIHGNMMDLYNAHTEAKWGKLPSLYFQVEKFLIRDFSRVFVVREDGVMFYKRRYPSLSKRFSFLPTWVDDETFYPFKNNGESQKKRLEFIKKSGFSLQDKLLLFVGRLEGQKNPLLLIDTFFYITRQLPEIRLLVVGAGGLKKKMERQIKQYGIDEKVHFFGAQPQEKVAELMRVSDVFLLPSAFEGMPISVLEALGCGLPVVSTDVGEVKRVVRNGFSGIISSEQDSVKLGDSVLKIFSKQNEFSAENCLLSIKDYTASRILAKVYQKFRAG
jgi:glycosyltransferase involved in cell wall biosynthesis